MPVKVRANHVSSQSMALFIFNQKRLQPVLVQHNPLQAKSQRADKNLENHDLKYDK
jgi:hypothetical protein